MPDLTEDLQKTLRVRLEMKIRSGFADLATLPGDCGEIFADDAESADVAAFSRAVLQDLLIDYRAEQQRWPATTDCDRLDAAFAELGGSGIVARQNFWCCATGGVAAIGEEMEEEGSASGVKVRGYTSYHEQDTESAVDGGSVYLSCGAVEDGEAAALGIAHEIEETLRRHGLATRWDGTHGQRVQVMLDWKRRSP